MKPNRIAVVDIAVIAPTSGDSTQDFWLAGSATSGRVPYSDFYITKNSLQKEREGPPPPVSLPTRENLMQRIITKYVNSQGQ